MKLFKKKVAPTPLSSSRIPEIPMSELPGPIAKKLRAAAARIRRIIFLRGSLSVLTAAIISIFTIMVIDAIITIFNPFVRWGLWCGGLVAVVLTAITSLVRPLSVKLTPARLAALVERGHPELQERLSTVVELLSYPDSLAEGSDELIKVLTDAAVSDVGNISVRRQFTGRTIHPKFIAISTLLLVFATLYAIWPKSIGRLFVRAIIPSAQIDNLYADNLTVTPGDAVLLEGSSFEVELAVRGGFPGQAYVRTSKIGSTREISERMSQTSAEKEGEATVRHYRFGVGSVEESFRYRVVCGSAVTRQYTVTAVPMPDYGSLSITLTPPEYTLAPTVSIGAADLADASIVSGTKASIRVLPNRELDGVLLCGGREIAGTLGANSFMDWEIPLSATDSGQWAIQMSDSNGFTNTPAYYSFNVVPDATPVACFTSPTNSAFSLPSYGSFSYSYQARDDFGIEAPELQVNSGMGWNTLEVLSATPREPRVWTGSGTIDLAEAGAEPGRTLRLRIKVSDKCPEEFEGPHTGFSEVITIKISGQARSMTHQKIEGEQKAVQNSLFDVSRNLGKALDKAREAHGHSNAGRDEKSLESIAQSKDFIKKADSIVRNLLSGLGGSDFEALAPEARSLLSSKISPALEAADEAALVEASYRQAAIRDLMEILEDAMKNADGFEKDLKDMAEELQKAADIKDMADMERELARQAKKEMTPEELAEWERKQEELKNKLEAEAEALKNTDPLKEEVKKAQNLEKDFNDLAQKQEKLENITKKLNENPDDQAAKNELEKMTSDMPKDATDMERVADAQRDIAREAENLAQQAKDLSESVNSQRSPSEIDPMAATLAQTEESAARARDAMPKPSDEPPKEETTGSKGNYDEEPKGGDKPNEGENSKEHNWDGKRGEEMEQAMDAASDSMKKASEAMRDATAKIEQISENMKERNAQAAKEAMDAMQSAQDAMKQQGERQQGDQQNGDPQQGDQQQGQQQQGDQQQAAQDALTAAEKLQQLSQQLSQQAGQQNGPQKPGQQQDQQQNQPNQQNQPSSEPGKPSGQSDSQNAEPGPEGEVGVPLEPTMSDAEWFKTKGDARANGTGKDTSAIPAEYRGLVKDYFDALGGE